MYDFLERHEIAHLIEEATKPLLVRIAQLEAQTDEWIDTKMALRLTGIKSDNTLRLERDRPGTLLHYKGEGKGIRYSRASCVAHNESKRLRKEQPTLLGGYNAT